MNLFNRIVLVLVCLALAAGSLAIIALAWTIPVEGLDWLRGAADWMEERNQDMEKALLTTGAAFVALIAVIVIIVELLPRSGPDVKVADLKGANASLSTAAIGQRVEEAVNRVPHVSEAKAAVKSKRKGVLLALELFVDPEANVADVTDQAVDAAQDVLTNRVHVALVKPPKVKLHYRELRLRGGQGAGRRPIRTVADASEPDAPIAPPPEPLFSRPAAAGTSDANGDKDAADRQEATPAGASTAVATEEKPAEARVAAETSPPATEEARTTAQEPAPDGQKPDKV